VGRLLWAGCGGQAAAVGRLPGRLLGQAAWGRLRWGRLRWAGCLGGCSGQAAARAVGCCKLCYSSHHLLSGKQLLATAAIFSSDILILLLGGVAMLTACCRLLGLLPLLACTIILNNWERLLTSSTWNSCWPGRSSQGVLQVQPDVGCPIHSPCSAFSLDQFFCSLHFSGSSEWPMEPCIQLCVTLFKPSLSYVLLGVECRQRGGLNLCCVSCLH
jgi:hypothetical protein